MSNSHPVIISCRLLTWPISRIKINIFPQPASNWERNRDSILSLKAMLWFNTVQQLKLRALPPQKSISDILIFLYFTRLKCYHLYEEICGSCTVHNKQFFGRWRYWLLSSHKFFVLMTSRNCMHKIWCATCMRTSLLMILNIAFGIFAFRHCSEDLFAYVSHHILFIFFSAIAIASRLLLQICTLPG